MTARIAGIQQIGLGVSDAAESFRWYRERLGMDIRIFDGAAQARLMTRYTGSVIHSRRAILALNLAGGGGMEIWQYTSRTPQPPPFEVQLGDLGIFAARIKSTDVARAHVRLSQSSEVRAGPLRQHPAGGSSFWVQDPAGNRLNVVEGHDWFGRPRGATGGVSGSALGVTDMDRAMGFYRDVVGFDHVRMDVTGVFPDLAGLPGGDRRFRRVLLGHLAPRSGAFSPLLGAAQLELFSAADGGGRPILGGRQWGDLGFIHLCFDVSGMDALKARCEALGFPFTIDSASSFEMGEAAGRFVYLEDPDGTLIELVETHRVPILKRLGLYVDLRRRDPARPLPTWMLKALALNRVR